MDFLNNFIFVCSNEMMFCRIIIKSSKNENVRLKTFAIDANSGYLFLTKFDPKSRVGAAIQRYSMDGKDMISLISEKLFYPIELTLDIAMKKIYFLDYYFDFIQQCNYDGSKRQFLQKLPLVNKVNYAYSKIVNFKRVKMIKNIASKIIKNIISFLAVSHHILRKHVLWSCRQKLINNSNKQVINVDQKGACREFGVKSQTGENFPPATTALTSSGLQNMCRRKHM